MKKVVFSVIFSLMAVFAMAMGQEEQQFPQQGQMPGRGQMSPDGQMMDEGQFQEKMQMREQKMQQMNQGQMPFGEMQSMEDSETVIPTEVKGLDDEEMFTDGDFDDSYSGAVKISLSNKDVVITEEGTYLLTGTLKDAQVTVAVADTEKVHLVLGGVTMSSNDTAPLYIEDADKVFITLAKGTKNSISVTGDYVETEEGIDGALYAKSDIVFNGEGTLTINAEYGHGIVAKDDVKFISGTYYIEAEKHGVTANDSIRIYDGDFTVASGKDAMKADNDEADKGYVYINDGNFSIFAGQDGISSSGTMHIEDGVFDIKSGVGYEKGNEGFVRVLDSITQGEGSGNTVQPTDSLEDSLKGLKAQDMLINGGEFTLSTYEDAVHSNGDLTINGGSFTIKTGDDAIHADNSLIINDIDVSVLDGYEGLEGDYIIINDGLININVLDDAINVGSTGGVLEIHGGDIAIACQGDGLDSNGDFEMTGGDIVFDVNAIHAGGDGNVDISGVTTYTGGTLKNIDGTVVDPTQKLMGPGRRRF